MLSRHRGDVDVPFRAKIRLLLADVVLPRMTGKQLAERLRLAQPDLRVLFMSGYTDEAIAQHGVIDAGVPYIEKPITIETLTRRVREALAPEAVSD